MRASALEQELAFQIRAVGLAEPEREYRFAPPRRFRFDFAWPAMKLAAEVEGGHWIQGRHNRPLGFQSDIEKYNLGVMRGWSILRFTREMIQSGEAVKSIEHLLTEMSD